MASLVSRKENNFLKSHLNDIYKKYDLNDSSLIWIKKLIRFSYLNNEYSILTLFKLLNLYLIKENIEVTEDNICDYLIVAMIISEKIIYNINDVSFVELIIPVLQPKTWAFTKAVIPLEKLVDNAFKWKFNKKINWRKEYQKNRTTPDSIVYQYLYFLESKMLKSLKNVDL